MCFALKLGAEKSRFDALKLDHKFLPTFRPYFDQIYKLYIMYVMDLKKFNLHQNAATWLRMFDHMDSKLENFLVQTCSRTHLLNAVLVSKNL